MEDSSVGVATHFLTHLVDETLKECVHFYAAAEHVTTVSM